MNQAKDTLQVEKSKCEWIPSRRVQRQKLPGTLPQCAMWEPSVASHTSNVCQPLAVAVSKLGHGKGPGVQWWIRAGSFQYQRFFFSLAVLLRPCVCSVLCSSECLLRAWPGLHLLYSSTASTLERANNKGRQGRYSCQGPWASVAALLKMTGSTCPARRWLWRPPLLGESIGEPDERDAWIQLVTFYLR